MRTYIAIPPLSSLSGGLRVLYHLAGQLNAAGFSVCLAPRERHMPGLDAVAAPGSPACPICAESWEDIRLDPQDIWLCPEGWPNALMPGLRSGARTVVYVQNWAYLLSALPPGVHLSALPLHFLAVSHPVSWFIRQVTGKDAQILPPGLNLQLFRPTGQAGQAGQAGKPSEKTAPGKARPVRVAWMPRKNKALAVQARAIVEARASLGKNMTPAELPQVEWVEIHKRPPEEVAELLASCHIFLATGFPEGFALPPLEAMACGCLVAGFSGLGGLDYMRPYTPQNLSAWPHLPLLFDLPPVLWGANALLAPDGDALALALALEEALRLVCAGGADYHTLIENARLAAAHYSLEAQAATARSLWSAYAGQAMQNLL